MRSRYQLRVLLSTRYSRACPQHVLAARLYTITTSSKSTQKRDQLHTSLSSFLDYAGATSLSPHSTIYTGTLYEYVVLQSLSRLGIALERTGGVSDKGIDLLGAWRLPTLPADSPLRVIVQCKALRRKAGPAVVRELEGAFAAVPPEWKSRGANGGAVDCIGVLAAPLEATKGVRDAMGRSRWPMGYAKVNQDGRIEQLLWNKSAAERGLDGMIVTVRHVPRKSSSPLVASNKFQTDESDTPVFEAEDVTKDVAKEQKQVLNEVVLTLRGETWEFTEPELREWYSLFQQQALGADQRSPSEDLESKND